MNCRKMSLAMTMGVVIFAGIALLSVYVFAAVVRPPVAPPKSPTQELGDSLFVDTNLSVPAGTSCETCHLADIFWADPRREATSAGSIGTSGTRNASQMSYSVFSPFFHQDAATGEWIGGQFWDGRAVDLHDQTGDPFLNPIEKGMTLAQLCNEVRLAPYAPKFDEIFGPGSIDTDAGCDDKVRTALAAYISQSEFFNFRAKFDYFKAGLVRLTPKERRGRKLFNANCAVCHPSTPSDPADPASPILFTTFGYANLGVPSNPLLSNFGVPDVGLAGNPNITPLNDPAQRGKFKIPTLRNIQFTRPYSHNGFFTNLTNMVEFINTRDVAAAGWPVPDVPENIDQTLTGNLGLTPVEVKDLVAFLRTLTDGFVSATPLP